MAVALAAGSDNVAVAGSHRAFDRHVNEIHGSRHLLRISVPVLGAPLDIGEKQRCEPFPVPEAVQRRDVHAPSSRPQPRRARRTEISAP